MPPGRVVLLAADGPSSRMVWNALRTRFPDVHAVLEAPVPRGTLVRRRLKTLGALTVALVWLGVYPGPMLDLIRANVRF